MIRDLLAGVGWAIAIVAAGSALTVLGVLVKFMFTFALGVL